jgi:hypothetical protein
MEHGSIRVPIFTTQTAAQTSVPIDVRAYQELTFYLSSVGTTSSGVVTLEEADYDPNVGGIYSGTWSQIGATIAASTFSAGAMVAVHLPAPACYAYVRARISTLIGGGGTISVVLRAS